jgi:hypothetical protein
MGGENLSLCTPYRTLFRHRPPLREDTTRSVPLDRGDSALSVRPRPSLDPALVSREKRPTWHRTQGLFTVSSLTSPWCPGMVGHSWSTSLQPPLPGSTKLHLKAPRCTGLLLPYKRAGSGSRREKGASIGKQTNQSSAHRSTS